MNNCDLDKLSISGGRLEPAFKPNITKYKATVGSTVQSTSLNLQTSDKGASYSIRGGDGSKVIKLKDGVNTVSVEVTAEDGTVKIYAIEGCRKRGRRVCGLQFFDIVDYLDA